MNRKQQLPRGSMLVLAAALAACAEDPTTDELPGGGEATPTLPAAEPPASTDEEAVLEGACPLGATHACTAHNDAGCAAGTQYCVEGVWSDCRRDIARSLYSRDLSDGSSSCGEDGTTANACDAQCQAFAPEPPDFGAGSATIDWLAGPLGSLPAAALWAGLSEPCDGNEDCRIDHYCAAGPSPRSCVAYEPFESNAACGARYDVTAGVGCVDGAVGTIPLCNRGNTTIPEEDLSTFRVLHSLAPSYDMNGCSLTGPSVSSCAVTATADLEAGRCINVPCDGILPNSRVYVDAGTANPDECECRNNWTFNTDAACGEPSCGSDVAVAEEIPVTILLAMDVSGSMDAGSPTRLEAVQAAMESFVADPASGGVGIALKFWPEGRCERPSTGNPGACDADAPYVDEATCDTHPCAPAAVPLEAACNADVATVCGTSKYERCCGEMPEAGTCAFAPCGTSSETLAAGCVSEVASTCAKSGFERCCGDWPGNCAKDPCEEHATNLTSCNNSSNTAIRDVCDDVGFEHCCGGTLSSSGAWGTSLPPCTASPGTGMQCRNNGGASKVCSTLSIPGSQVNSRAARMKAFLATPAGAGCQSSWTSTCVTNFRAFWAATVGGDPCATTGWDATCVDQWATKVPAGTCNKAWDSACAADYASRVSSSSTKKCTQTKQWDAACAAKFDEVSDGSCTACDHPSIPLGASSVGDYRLEVQAGPRTSLGGTDDAEEQLVEAIRGAEPGGNTPTHPALTGAIDFCRDYQAAHPGERAVVVFATDGEPYGCNPSGSLGATTSDKNAIRAIAAAGRADDVYTYTVGIEGSSTTFMNQLAQSGGTSAAFLLGSGSQATEDLKDALIAIRNQFSCSYALPAGATQDQIVVRWNDGTISPVIERVSDVTECGAVTLGYYPTSATEIALCAGTCETIRSTPGTNVEIVVGCGVQAVPITVVEELSAGDVCGDQVGTYPRWTVMLYDANVPPGSSIEVSLRTRHGDGSGWAASVPLTTITSSNENATLASPVSLSEVLGSGAFARDIEITFTSTVEGGAPTLLGYELEFTCAATE